jgi:hypothetical protein
MPCSSRLSLPVVATFVDRVIVIVIEPLPHGPLEVQVYPGCQPDLVAFRGNMTGRVSTREADRIV